MAAQKSKSVKASASNKAAKKPAAKLPKTSSDAQETKRLWLMYPAKLITRPIIWELGQKFPVVFNIRQVSVTEEIGIVCLELDGKRSVIKDAIKWLESQGISVEPVEINVIES
jgi:arsenate reductase-like glutaredoxin family protein